MARLWLTRSQPFADESAARLRAMGYDVCAAPLLETVELARPDCLPKADAVLIFTSRKAVMIFAKNIEAPHWPSICVGNATAKAARDAGFETVYSAQGASGDVITWIKHNISHETPLYHASSGHPRGDIIETLQQDGFSYARRETFYRAEKVAADPRSNPRGDDIVLLYSPMAAESLAALNLDMSKMEIISLSPAIDAVISTISCKARHIAENPTEDSLFSHLP